jgi:hypothetical protein
MINCGRIPKPAIFTESGGGKYITSAGIWLFYLNQEIKLDHLSVVHLVLLHQTFESLP